MGLTHKQQLNKRWGLQRDEAHTLVGLQRRTGVPVKVLREVYNRGVGAHRTNPTSVRLKGSYAKDKRAGIPLVRRLSAEQWGLARVYAFLNKLYTGRLNHDTDLARRVGALSARTGARE